jgi:hypothetical protein
MIGTEDHSDDRGARQVGGNLACRLGVIFDGQRKTEQGDKEDSQSAAHDGITQTQRPYIRDRTGYVSMVRYTAQAGFTQSWRRIGAL